MDGRKGNVDPEMLETKRTDLVDQQTLLSQSLSAQKVKEFDPLPASEVEMDDVTSLTIDCLYRGDAADSEQETSDIEDGPLQSAGIWTEDEAALLTKKKLVHLQSLYINQFKRLRHLLQLRYRHYCREMEHTRRAATYNLEKPTSSRFIPRQQSQAVRRYKRRVGGEKLLHQLSKERRRAAAFGEQTVNSAAVRKSQAANNSQQCLFVDESTSCVETSMPFSKYCRKHILSDPHQLLYQRCSHQTTADSPCDVPVLSCHSNCHCLLHTQLPAAMTDEVTVKKTMELAAQLHDQENMDECEMQSEKSEESALSFRKYLHLDLAADMTRQGPFSVSTSEKKDGDRSMEESLKTVRVSDDSETADHSPSSGNLLLVKLQARTIAQLTNEQLQRAYEEQGVVIGSREGSESRDGNTAIEQSGVGVATSEDTNQPRANEYKEVLSMAAVAPDNEEPEEESEHKEGSN